VSGSFHDHDHSPGMHGDHVHVHSTSMWGYFAFTAAVGVLLLLNGLGKFTTLFGFNTALLIAIVAGYKIIYQAMLDLLNRRLSADLAIAVAAIAAVAVGEYFAAAEVMFIMLVGEGLEHYTVARAKRAIAGFVQMTPTVARVRRDGAEIELHPNEVKVGDTVIVRAGEKVPVDGIVVLGQSSVDETMITGEPLPAQKGAGDALYSGSVNEYGVLEARAERVGEDTTLARISRLIAEAQKHRAPIERTADEFAKYFLPVVLVAGGAIYFFTGETLRAVAALIVACPCALVLATPAAVAASIARLAREGVLVKGGTIIEALARIRAVAFDKTGTLTAGRPRVSDVAPAPGVSENDVLALAAAAEKPSEHLLGREIVKEAARRGLVLQEPQDFAIRPGLGVQARVDGKQVRVGNLALAREAATENLDWAEAALFAGAQSGQTRVIVLVDGKPIGVIGLSDPLRPDAAEAVLRLKEMGISRILMVTGDEELAAKNIGRQAGIAEIYARLLPEDKAQKIRELRNEGLRILMAGDGVNDSPSLAVADVGLAMGRGAADISAEAAHVVFLKDRLDQIPDLIAFTRKTIQRIRSSIILFAFGVNLIAVLGAAFGYLSPPIAAIVHQAASLFVILNCVRLLIEGKAVEESRLSAVAGAWRHRWQHARHDLGMHGWHEFSHKLSHHRRAIRNWSAAAITLLWILSGFALVGPDQVGVVWRFGRLAVNLDPGIHYRWPWPIEKVTRLAPRRVQVVEIGYRTNLEAASGAEGPSVYEWNTQHRQGRYRKVAEESLMLTGDENLVEVNAVAQYSIRDPAFYLFNVKEPETLIRAVAERTLRWIVARHPLDAILTDQRSQIELAWQGELSEMLKRYDSGLEVLSVRLQDVHPPVEVVEAFRDVASALEEKSTRINEAESYLLEQVPLARGQARARLLAAEGYSKSRIERSRGESARFAEREQAYRKVPEVTSLRLYFEAVEQVLPNKQKYIADSKKLGRRRFLFLDAKDLNLLNLVEPGKEKQQEAGNGSRQR
jgi:HflK protein